MTPVPHIITGNNARIIPTLDDGSVDLVVTSPPYPGQLGNDMSVPEWLRWINGLLGQLHDKLTPAGVIVLNAQIKRTDAGWYDNRISRLGDPGWSGYRVLDIYIWGKPNPPPNGALTYCDPAGFEHVFVLTRAGRPEDVTFNPVRKPYARKSINSRGRVYTGNGSGLVGGRGDRPDPHPDGARQSTLMLLSSSGDQNRPRAKGMSFPRDLPERFIRQYSDPGDLVLDPFCGVGTTCRVAYELGRRAIGIEIDPDEAQIARDWLAQPVQRPLLEVTP